ncbi:hypothetical protein Ae201684P_022066 [Aphanomyces euteiches]|nr:hypothetical protein Ae201684P_022066 [Aphanomyces euteiches]
MDIDCIENIARLQCHCSFINSPPREHQDAELIDYLRLEQRDPSNSRSRCRESSIPRLLVNGLDPVPISHNHQSHVILSNTEQHWAPRHSKPNRTSLVN